MLVEVVMVSRRFVDRDAQGSDALSGGPHGARRTAWPVYQGWLTSPFLGIPENVESEPTRAVIAFTAEQSWWRRKTSCSYVWVG